MKRSLLIILTLFNTIYSMGQLSLEYCHQKALEQSPLKKQKLQYETMELLTGKNISTIFYPKINVNGQATYQSDVLSFPSNPLMETPIIPKEQFKVAIDVTQNLYDGGWSKNRRIVEQARSVSDIQTVEVELYKIKQMVNQLFFGALLFQERILIYKNLLKELNDQFKIIQSRVEHGVLLSSSEDKFKKQILTAEQQELEARLDLEATLDMLGLWIGEDLGIGAPLEIPDQIMDNLAIEIQRPELELFNTQVAMFKAMEGSAVVNRRPKINAFFQGGIGKPNPMNWLETSVSPFYLLGLRLQWNILDYGTARREGEIYRANSMIVDARSQNFEEHIKKQLIREAADIQKMQSLLTKDQELIQLQAKVTSEAFSQLQNGVIEANDYLAELNDKTRLEIQSQIHRIQLIEAQYNKLTISGNF